MQLKKIELQGFKSFADRTEIEFLNGVTTIVGPNGSGKSNISDAVRWVLGEQSVKNLRGSKMEDVIFAGTQNRKKQGFAYVSIYLDNSDKTLPIEYSEVVVTRKIYRTGETGYYINDSECRLKDVQELFMDTGIGKDGYSIISQGKIDEILSNNSEQRRNIFEEASGIVKYKVRKEEASRKLEDTNINLVRVNDVLAEIENNINDLEQKANIAKKYLDLKEKLKYIDVKLFLKSVQKNNEGVGQIDQNIAIFQNDKKQEEKYAIDIEKQKTDLKSKLKDISDSIDLTQQNYYQNQTKYEKLNSNISIVNEKILNLKNDIERLEEEIDSDTTNVTDLKEEINKKTVKKEQLFNDKKKFEIQLKQKQQEYQNLREGMDQKQLEIEKLKADIETYSSEKYSLNEKNSSFLATIEADQKQLEYISKSQNNDSFQKIKQQQDQIVLNLKQNSQKVEEIKKELSNLKNEEYQQTSEKSQINNRKQEIMQELMTIKSKYNYLKNLEDENEGYYRSVKEVLNYSKSSLMPGVYGSVSSIISTQQKYEYAIEIALGGYLQNVVVKSDIEAKKLISYLKQNSLGRVTFLPLDSIKPYTNESASSFKKFEGFIGMATDLVDYDPKYQKAVHLALNRVVIVDNLENAIAISKQIHTSVKIVTLSGELISSSGSITGGQNKVKSSGLIGRQDKLKKLQELQIKYQEDIDKILQKQKEIDLKASEISKNKHEKENELNQANIDEATLNEKYSNILKEFKKQETMQKSSQELKLNLEQEIKNLNECVQKNKNQIEDLTRKSLEKKVIVDEYTRFNKEKIQKSNLLNEDITDLKISLSSFDESVSSIDEMKDKIEQDIKNFEQAILKKKNQIEVSNTKLKQYDQKILDINKEINAMNEFENKYSEILQNLKLQKDKCIKNQEVLDVKTMQSVAKLDKIKEEITKLESKKIKYNLEIENLKNNIWDDYELTISSAKKYIESIPVNQDQSISNLDFDKQKKSIEESIKDLGIVDVGSIEEYKKTKKRFDFITSQKQDLDQTKTKLQNLIENMTTLMKQQFESQFKLIATNFEQTFKELFGGGKAKIELENCDNVLESGIEIKVEPPGKKLQNMMLLSGGERSLTAIALLFAILKIKAPPFCILDEIEAALDDVNVQRFAKYIKKYSDNTQFIVITHRKGTMEVASSVYGITMQEYGISKVISMKMA